MTAGFSSYGSSIGKMLGHFTFKVKYCHRVFEYEVVKKRCEEIFREVAMVNGFCVKEVGFDRDHVHADVDMTNKYAAWQIAKFLKGTTGRKLLKEFPWLKRKYFWGSGFWNPSYFFDSIGARTVEQIENYIRKQGKKNQLTLTNFLNN